MTSTQGRLPARRKLCLGGNMLSTRHRPAGPGSLLATSGAEMWRLNAECHCLFLARVTGSPAGAGTITGSTVLFVRITSAIEACSAFQRSAAGTWGSKHDFQSGREPGGSGQGPVGRGLHKISAIYARGPSSAYGFCRRQKRDCVEFLAPKASTTGLKIYPAYRACVIGAPLHRTVGG